MPAANKIVFDKKSGISIWVEGQELPVVIQPTHPRGRAWKSPEEGVQWAKAFAAQNFGYIDPDFQALEEEPVEEEPVEETPVEEIPAEEEPSA